MKYIFYFFWVILPIGLFGQTKITASKTQFLIGEQITLYFEINNFQKEADVIFYPWKDVILCPSLLEATTPKELEILFFRDTIIRDKETQLIAAYTITAWDTGTFVLPRHAYQIDHEQFFFDEFVLHVSAPQISSDDQIMESELPFQDYEIDHLYLLKKYLPWFLGSLILLVLLLWLLMRKNKRENTDMGSAVPLLERTMLAIETLENKKLIAQGKVREHYVESSYIFRNYLGEHFNLNILEKTSEQTRILLISKGLPSSLILEIQLLLNTFDSVKFAKFNPELSESELILINLKSTILKINNWSLKDV